MAELTANDLRGRMKQHVDWFQEWRRAQLFDGVDEDPPADEPEDGNWNLHAAEMAAGGEAMDEFARHLDAAPLTAAAQFHLPGKHDQRTHGRRHGVIGLTRQVPTGETADHVAKWHRDLDGLADMIADAEVGYGPTDFEELGGGDGTLFVAKVRYRNGSTGLIKQFEPGSGPDRQADAEQLVALTGQVIGAPVPRVLRTQADEIRMEWVDGVPDAEMSEKVDLSDQDAYSRFHDQREAMVESVGGLRVGLLDLLTRNTDRHEGNWMWTAGGPVGIDHGYSFEFDQPEGAGKNASRAFVSSPFVSKFVGVLDLSAQVIEWKPNPLTAADAAFLRQKVDELRDDYETMDRLDWWQYMSDVADQLAANADGGNGPNVLAPAGWQAAAVAGGAEFHLPGRHDQRDHGRRGLPPAGKTSTPGAPHGHSAERVSAWMRDASHAGSLLETLDSGLAGEPQLLGGGVQGKTFLAEFQNGEKAIRKQFVDRTDAGLDLERAADAETLAATLGTVIGAPVPVAVRTDADEVWIEHVSGPTLSEIREHPMTRSAAMAEMMDELVASDDGVRLGLLDLLTLNFDHVSNGNVMLSDSGRLVGIDQGASWSEEALAKAGRDPSKPAAVDLISPFSRQFLVQSGTRWKDNPLHPDDVEWLRTRLADLEDDFEAAGRHDWWEFAVARLEAIAPHATGTRRLFGG